MKYLKSQFPGILFLIAALVVLINCNKTQSPVNEDLKGVRDSILAVNSEFKKETESLLRSVENGHTQNLQKGFDHLRLTYKRMEWAVEYFLPHSARFINGPAIPEIEMEEHTVLEPQGLQMLETYFYPEYNAENKAEVIRHLKIILSKSGTIDANFKSITMNRSQVFDALRDEVFRISSLGIAGFDTPVSGKNLSEIPVVLQSITSVITRISGGDSSKEKEQIISLANAAGLYLNKNQDREQFDYSFFIPNYLNKISKLLLDLKIKEKIPNVEITSVVTKNAATLYDKDAYNPDAFVPGEEYKMTAEKVALGKTLFRDPVLSQGNNRSCATCHIPELAFTDGRGKSLSLENRLLARNTPSLSYSAYQHGQFWDMRKEDLEGQSSDVITNKEEMHGDMDAIVRKLNEDQKYLAVFKQIYKTPNAEVWQLQNVLASYIRSLGKFNSNFDEYMRGNPSAMTASQREGFNLFVGKGKCATCHFLPLFNGTVPPKYAKTEQEILGTAMDGRNLTLDPDLGRGKFHETVEFLQYSFKTPTLRNIAKTAPYMHNGGYKTLKEVMHFYNKGGGEGLGLNVKNQTLPPDPLNLTELEIDKIIDFMGALSDK